MIVPLLIPILYEEVYSSSPVTSLSYSPGAPIIGGSTILLTHTFYDQDGNLYDPPDVRLSIVRSVVRSVYGPYFQQEDQIQRVSEGEYRFIVQIDDFLTPGVYSAKWSATIVGERSIEYETFHVLEPEVVPSEILDPPRIYGTMRESSLYRNMGMGTTDRIFLVGHAPGVPLNSPYEVRDMKEAINYLGADIRTPLVRALLEAYNAGGRDIWLVAAAPLVEYVDYDFANPENRFFPRAEWGGKNFYERYLERLETTLLMLEEWDLIELMVIPDAPFYDAGDVDFVYPQIINCANRFALSGAPSIAIIGSLVPLPSDVTVEAMLEDGRFDFDATQYFVGGELPEEYSTNQFGKFGILCYGEGTVNVPQSNGAYRAPLAATIAGVLASTRLDRGLTYRKLPNVLAPIGKDLKKQQVIDLARRHINPVIRTGRGKRGLPYETVLATDNLLSPDGSDYWALPQMRLVVKVMQELRAIGNRSIGGIGYGEFQRQCQNYLDGLVAADYMRSYKIDFNRSTTDLNDVVVSVTLRPYAGVREIFFQVMAGPGV